MKTQHIIPDKNCKQCHGTGTVYDYVPYGSTTTAMPSYCACVEDQMDDDIEEVIIDPLYKKLPIQSIAITVHCGWWWVNISRYLETPDSEIDKNRHDNRQYIHGDGYHPTPISQYSVERAKRAQDHLYKVQSAKAVGKVE